MWRAAQQRLPPILRNFLTMLLVHQPDHPAIQAFLAAHGQHPFSYDEIGRSRDGAPARYDVDHNRVQVGHGKMAFEIACDAIRRWKMFPDSWMRICPRDTPIEPGRVVALLIRAGGLWWMNAARIVYVVDVAAPIRQFGFAYGTLPAHVECGEERFLIEWDDQDRVWYDIRAFSRPRHWLVRLGYPLVRRLQKRFVAESQAVMKELVADATAAVPWRKAMDDRTRA
jgi:uncharacterized protein (UPF0548 family)